MPMLVDNKILLLLLLLLLRYYYCFITFFCLPFFLNAKSPVFTVGFFEKPAERTKDPKWPAFAN